MEGVLSSTDKQSMVSSFLEIAVGQTADTAKQFLQVMIFFFFLIFFISDFFDNKVCIFGTKRLNLLLGFHYYYYYFWVLILVCVLNFGAV